MSNVASHPPVAKAATTLPPRLTAAHDVRDHGKSLFDQLLPPSDKDIPPPDRGRPDDSSTAAVAHQSNGQREAAHSERQDSVDQTDASSAKKSDDSASEAPASAGSDGKAAPSAQDSGTNPQAVADPTTAAVKALQEDAAAADKPAKDPTQQKDQPDGKVADGTPVPAQQVVTAAAVAAIAVPVDPIPASGDAPAISADVSAVGALTRKNGNAPDTKAATAPAASGPGPAAPATPDERQITAAAAADATRDAAKPAAAADSDRLAGKHQTAADRADVPTAGSAGSAPTINAKPDATPNVPLPPSQIAAPAAQAAQAAPAAAIPVTGLAVEIAARAQNGQNRFEIRLDPPELGRIDVRLHVNHDGQVSSHVVVDRADTLDLLRRDASDLQRSLQQAGLKTSDNGLQFSLRDQSFTNNPGTRQNMPMAQVIVPDRDMPLPEIATRGYLRAGLGSGLDISV